MRPIAVPPQRSSPSQVSNGWPHWLPLQNWSRFAASGNWLPHLDPVWSPLHDRLPPKAERERLKTMRKDKMSARHSFGSQWSIFRFEGPTGGPRQETSLRPQKSGSFMFGFFGSRTLPTNNVICGQHPERGQGVHSVWFFPGGTKASAWVYRSSFYLFELLRHNNSGNVIVWLAGIFFKSQNWKDRRQNTHLLFFRVGFNISLLSCNSAL